MKRNRLIYAVAMLLVLCTLATTAFAAVAYWASAKSNVYHYPDCRYAKGIKEIYLIKFSSPEEAIKSGYRPCKVCNPPEDSPKN